MGAKSMPGSSLVTDLVVASGNREPWVQTEVIYNSRLAQRLSWFLNQIHNNILMSFAERHAKN